MSFIVAIDGPAGSGKGTVAKLTAEKIGFFTMDTGAMYRCVTVYLIDNKIRLNEDKKIENALSRINLDMKQEDGVMKFFINGTDVTERIRTKEVDNLVSQVSHLIQVRTAMVNLQRELAKGKNMIMEGRDIGTNVFPNAEVKIYLDASPEERARRRVEQNKAKGIPNITYEEILENVRFRDYNDLNSSVAPLKKAPDAILVDSTSMTIEEVVDKISNIIIEKQNNM